MTAETSFMQLNAGHVLTTILICFAWLLTPNLQKLKLSPGEHETEDNEELKPPPKKKKTANP